MNEKQILDMFGALSQETRLHIVRYLVCCGEKGAAAGEIGQHVGAASSRASFHLSALENAGVISSKRQSRQIIYSANIQNLGGLISFLLNDCCNNHPDIRACSGGEETHIADHVVTGLKDIQAERLSNKTIFDIAADEE